jgi:hypothetical protein
MSTFDPSALMSLLQQNSGAASDLSGSNKYATFPSSNNATPDVAPAAPPSAPPPSNPPPPPLPPSNASTQQQQRLQGIKGYLSNILYGVGEGMKAHLGMETDAQQQQRQFSNQLAAQKQQSDIQWRASQTALNAPQPIMDQREADALGLQVGDMVSPAQKSLLYQQALKNKGNATAATIKANATVNAAGLRAMATLGQTTMKAAYMPDGTLGVGLYDKSGNFRGYADNAVVPAQYLEKIKQGQTFKVDSEGNLQSIPTTNITRPLVPPSPAQQPNKIIPDGSSNFDPKQGLQNILNKAKPPSAVSNGPNANPVMINGQPFKSATAADTVYATDPKTGQQIFTDRSTAIAQGLQTPTKVTAVQVRKDQALSNRLADVQRKVGDYASTFDQPIDPQDQQAIAYLMDNNIGAGLNAHGINMNLLPQYVQSQLKARGIQALSDAGMKRYILFNQARESLSGYQQILTNSSRSSDKVLELQLEQLPPPLADKQFADQATGQFQQNLDLAGQHMPMFPGSSETQQSIKASQVAARGQTAAIQANQDKAQQMQANQPPRPSNVPIGYVYKANGPKGRGWYKP